MKRLFIVLILALSATISNAQSIEKQAVYKYGLIVYLDGNGVPKDSMEAQGIILLAKFGNQEMISITIGDQEVHTGLIIRKKEEKVDSNTKLVVYLAIQEFNGYKVPLQIFEEYNLAKSKFIPDKPKALTKVKNIYNNNLTNIVFTFYFIYFFYSS